VSTEYRLLTIDDYEQAATVEARAFYNTPSADYVERLREFFPPEWTVGGFVDGKLVADTRTIPHVRKMHGAAMKFGAVGPVACAAPYRRQGHVNKVLTLALETMHERGQVLSGLHTPHDALYQRFGWERAHRKLEVKLKPKYVQLRERGAHGRMEAVGSDDWQRLDAIYREATADSNGPFIRNQVWWQMSVFKHWRDGKLVDNDAVVWIDENGQDRGYVMYWDSPAGKDGPFDATDIWVHHYYALTSDAYLGIWRHLLTHDLASHIVAELHPNDPFVQLCEPPFAVASSPGWGAMIRVVDVENAIAQRPYLSDGTAALTLRIEDRTLPFNDGTWRLEAGEGRMHAERTTATPDAECTVNTLASLFTGYLTPEWAARSGFLRVTRPEAIEELARLFAVKDAPFSPEHY
jgi:predicted acetyltransferase